MTAANLTMSIILLAITGYALLGGADFGGGLWDLLAGAQHDELAGRRRRLIEHSLGPVWEANHVWLIFAVVLLWTGFPRVFASVASTAYIPLTGAALGIIGRGSAFAFRKIGLDRGRRLYGTVFAFSSVVTPFFFGTVLGGIASGRIPLGIAAGGLVHSWWNPTSITTGVLAVGVCGYLAAAFLTADARRVAPELADSMRRRAMAAGIATGVLAIAGLPVVWHDAHPLAQRLLGTPGIWFVCASIAAGGISLVLLYLRRYTLVRLSASAAVAAVLWGWAAAQYPDALPGWSIAATAAETSVLDPLLISTAVGAVLLVPSLVCLFLVAQSGGAQNGGDQNAGAQNAAAQSGATDSGATLGGEA